MYAVHHGLAPSYITELMSVEVSVRAAAAEIIAADF